MQLHPTRDAVTLTIGGVTIVALGLLTNQAAILAWGGAILVGLQLARAVTLLSVTQIRLAGFEMLWREEQRVTRVARGEAVVLRAEVRNRDDRAARYVHLRALCSPHLDVRLEPDFGEVPAGGRLEVNVQIRGTRVGRHGIFGLSLEVQGGPGLYEVPLTFSNPLGVEVLPNAYHGLSRSPRGGRSRYRSDAGNPNRRTRGSSEFRELRDYQSGDPFKQIAWKASARRGKLVVREFDRQEREIVWFLVDASVELWAGTSGETPLDHALDAVAIQARKHLEHGNHVGLAIFAARKLAWLPPKGGPAQLGAIMEALAFNALTHDHDRCTLDEGECAQRVSDHLRPLVGDPTAEGTSLDGLATSASAALVRAPFTNVEPRGTTPRDQMFRTYLARFGVDMPARLEPDRVRSDTVLLEILQEALTHASKPTRVIVCSPVPRAEQRPHLMAGLRKTRSRRATIAWLDIGLGTGLIPPATANASAVRSTLELRSIAESKLGRRELGQLGIRCESNRTHSPGTTSS
jgi:uncharacterized protein (DUF58 family)